jgi:hypothetical protein
MSIPLTQTKLTSHPHTHIPLVYFSEYPTVRPLHSHTLVPRLSDWDLTQEQAKHNYHRAQTTDNSTAS